MFADVRALSWPILTYWGTLLLSMGLFSALFILAGNIDNAEDAWVLAGLWASTAFGVLFGQVCALTGLRSGVIVTMGVAAQVAGFVFIAWYGATVGEEGPVALFVAIFWFFTPFFAVAGLLSLRTSLMQIFALFAPLIWISASIILVSEDITGTAVRWFQGDKWAIWDLFTAPILLLGVGLSVAYLASRERHRIYRWMTGAGAAQAVTLRRVRGSAVGATASGCGTLVAAAILVVALTVGTGLLAPYLWRSAPAEDGEPPDIDEPEPSQDDGNDSDNDGVSDQQEIKDGTDPHNADTDGDGLNDGREKRKGSNPRDTDTDNDGVRDGDEGANGTSPTNPDTDGDGIGDADDPQGFGEGFDRQQLEETARHLGVSLFFLLMLVVLTLLGLLIFGPPLRRSLLLQSLRSPVVPTPPSERVANAWRLCEIALGDLGIPREPGDTPRKLVHSAVQRLPEGLNLEPLVETAEIADRVRHGLGLDPTDEERARRNAEMAYQSVWEALGEWEKVRAIYRWTL